MSQTTLPLSAVKRREAPLSAATVDIPAVPANPAGSAGIVSDGVSSIPLSPNAGEDTQSGGITPLYAGSANKPITLVDTAQVAINTVAISERNTDVTQTLEAQQTAQEGQSSPSIDVATSAHALHAAREDEALAILMILLESIA